MTVESAAIAADARPARWSSRTAVAIAGLAFGVLMSVIDQTIVATALPSITRDLGTTSESSWIVSAYLLTSTGAAVLYGRVSDLIGRRTAFIVALSLFTVMSVVAGISSSLPELVVARAFQGLGGGGLLTLATIAIAELVPPRARGRIQGLLGAVFALGAVGGPLLGGILSQWTSWRWIFFINVPLGVISLVLVTLTLRLPRSPHGARLDGLGALLVVIGVSCVVLITVWGGHEYAWVSAPTIILAVLAIGLLAAFWAWERRTASPLLPLRLLSIVTVRQSFLATLFLGGALFAAIIMIPGYLHYVNAWSPIPAGLGLVPFMLATVVASAVTGRHVSATGRYRRTLIVGSILAAAGYALLVGGATTSQPGFVIAAGAVIGVGLGSDMQLLVVIAQNVVAPADLATMTSALGATRLIGGAIAVSGLTGLVLGQAAQMSLNLAYGVGFGGAALLAVLLLASVSDIPQLELRTESLRDI